MSVSLLDLEMFEIYMVLAHGATGTIWTTLNLLLLRIIPANFNLNPTLHFQEDNRNVQSFQTTHNGHGRTAIVHLQPLAWVS